MKREFFKNLGKNTRGPRQFFRVLNKISKITLIPCFSRRQARKFFCWKILIVKRKMLRNFRFSTKMLLNSWVNAKTSAAGEFCCWKMLVYMLKMKNFWFKKCQIWGFFVEKWKKMDNFDEKLWLKNSATLKIFLRNTCF